MRELTESLSSLMIFSLLPSDPTELGDLTIPPGVRRAVTLETCKWTKHQINVMITYLTNNNSKQYIEFIFQFKAQM